MNDTFATAMGRALEQTRAGNPAQATATIQAALQGGGAQRAATPATERARRPLGQVIDSLVNGKAMARGAHHTSSAGPAIPEGASWDICHHDCAFGARDFRIFVPSRREEPLKGLILMLHGCTQTAEDFAVGTRMNLHAERHNLVVLYADQARVANQMGCWNWFRREDQGRDRGEPALLADLVTRIAADHDIPQGRIFVAGLSAGGAMAAILGAAYPEVFAAVGVHSGLAPGVADDVAGAYAAMRGQAARAVAPRGAPVRTIVFHGSTDPTVAPVNARAVIDAALGRSSSVLIEDSTSGAAAVHTCSATGKPLAELWTPNGIGHAWSGGAPEGSHTAPDGPDASAEMVRFFLSLDEEKRT